MQGFYGVHRGLPGLLRKGATEMSIGARITYDKHLIFSAVRVELDYDLTLRHAGAGAVISLETLVDRSERTGSPGREAFSVLSRDHVTGSYWHESRFVNFEPRHDIPGLATVASLPGDPRIEAARQALADIEVHLGFDTRASWAARTTQRPENIRTASTHFPANRLHLLGFNLVNAWSEIISGPRQEVEEALELLRLGLGDRVDRVVVKPDLGGGNVYLGVRFGDLPEPVFASDLSDGQLTWLAFVALARLNQGRSLLAFDEPEVHLHPALLGRVVSLLENLPGGAPVVLATHSDRVLELLDDPADAIRVCALDGGTATVSRLDPEALADWLQHYGDVGRLRASGSLHRVLA